MGVMLIRLMLNVHLNSGRQFCGTGEKYELLARWCALVLFFARTELLLILVVRLSLPASARSHLKSGCAATNLRSRCRCRRSAILLRPSTLAPASLSSVGSAPGQPSAHRAAPIPLVALCLSRFIDGFVALPRSKTKGSKAGSLPRHSITSFVAT